MLLDMFVCYLSAESPSDLGRRRRITIAYDVAYIYIYIYM